MPKTWIQYQIQGIPSTQNILNRNPCSGARTGLFIITYYTLGFNQIKCILGVVWKNQLYTEIIPIQPTISDLTDQLSSFYNQSNLERNIHQPYKSLKKIAKMFIKFKIQRKSATQNVYSWKLCSGARAEIFINIAQLYNFSSVKKRIPSSNDCHSYR